METVDEVFLGWISSKTLEPYNYWSRSPIEECDIILEYVSDALQHRILKKSIKQNFFPKNKWLETEKLSNY